MYNIPSTLSESVSVLPSGSHHRPEEYHHKNKKNSETSYLPSHLIVSSTSSQKSSSIQPPPETKQGRYRINRISKKIASVNVLLTSKLLRRHKRLGPPTTTTATTTNHNNTQEQVDTYNNEYEYDDDYDVTTSSLPKRTSSVTFQPYSLFGSTTNPEPQIKNNNNTMNPTTMLVKAAVPGAGGLFNFKGEEKDGVVTKVAPVWVWLFAGATVTVTVLTNFAFSSWFVYTCTGMTTVFAPYVVYQKTKIAELGSFRENYNVIRNLTNKFHNENNRLSSNVDDLEAQNDALKHVKDDLKELADDTTNLDRLVTVVKELQEVNAEIREELNAKIVQDIIKTVLSCDRDGDLKLSKKEMTKLHLRLVYSPGFDFNEARFKKILGKPLDGKNYDISRILDLIRNINDTSIPKEEAIFTLKPVKELKAF